MSTLFTCENESIDDQSEQINLEIFNLEKLQSDIRFKSYLEKNQNFIDNIKDANLVKALAEKENLNEQDLKRLSIAIGFKSYEEYLEYYESQKSTLIKLENDYKLSSYQISDIEEAIIITNAPVVSGQPNDCVKSCNRTSFNCQGAATAGAAVAHIGCLSADVTVIGGIVCHAAVAAVQYFVLDECINQEEQCLSRCGQ